MHNSMATATERGTTMKAIVREQYGSPDVLELQEVDRPELADDGVLVRVRAASVNQVDWYEVTGTPWIARPMTGLRGPKSPRHRPRFRGNGGGGRQGRHGPRSRVTRCSAASSGSFAEYVCARRRVAPKPANLTFEEAAAVPIAALTALQGLRDHGQLQPGQKVLVNGASGGVGTFAVQIAKALGAEVTAVCSTRNVEQARSLGADRVIDYTREDFTRGGERYDVILDVAGTQVVVAIQARDEPGCEARHGRSTEGESSARAARSLRQVEARGVARQPEGRLLHREVQQAGHGCRCASCSSPER